MNLSRFHRQRTSKDPIAPIASADARGPSATWWHPVTLVPGPTARWLSSLDALRGAQHPDPHEARVDDGVVVGLHRDVPPGSVARRVRLRDRDVAEVDEAAAGEGALVGGAVRVAVEVDPGRGVA